MKEPFTPDTLPLKLLDLGGMITEIGKANREIAAFGGLLQGIPNPFVLLSPLTSQEAVLSSKIEGTQASLQDMLKYEAGDKPTHNSKADDDIHEILNYRKAMTTAVDALNLKPITLNLIKDLHKVLLEGVRGQNMRRGEFRQNQNFIGSRGSSIEDASYIPPSPLQLLKHLDNWEKYIHSQNIDPLVQLSIVHAQFEIIHPFMDGNGRIGRMLIPLFLYEKKVIPYPTFYLSAYLETNREEYYDRLSAISKKGDWVGWIRFFLKAIAFESEKNSQKALTILKLYDKMKEQVAEWTRSQYAIAALETLFSSPIISSSDFKKRAKIPKPTAARILKILQDHKVLDVIRLPLGQKPAILAFTKLLNIVES
ncbi:MAG: Fic family protein [Waddliaceae bacterium]|jgi:Fic family protein|nr:Fic family protein [Waddliaceae bacterium]MBT3579517.1 Fic family protein [Waddliaceae bacterium]MBT4444565.1 Fic family protein [Waddliaceae bacterium]MBT6928630.1 Fic family protein [Waddliaceae bacterium]MBT7265168.1 Fic family protein [Waddliaceae bacterium]